MDETRGQVSERHGESAKDQALWLDFYEQQVASKQSAIGKFDSAVLAVSGVFLTFSVSFLRGDGQTQKSLLLTGWVFLAIAVACSVVSHLVAWFSGTYIVDEVAKICRGECDPAQVNFRRGRRPTTILNLASCGFLIVGSFALVAFAYASM